jgi:hypothetical protein
LVDVSPPAATVPVAEAVISEMVDIRGPESPARIAVEQITGPTGVQRTQLA